MLSVHQQCQRLYLSDCQKQHTDQEKSKQCVSVTRTVFGEIMLQNNLCVKGLCSWVFGNFQGLEKVLYSANNFWSVKSLYFYTEYVQTMKEHIWNYAVNQV